MRALVLCTFGLTVALSGSAETTSGPGWLVAPGFAVANVAPDSLSIEFELELSSDSFREGARAAREVAAELETIELPVDGVGLSVSRDLNFMQQKRWTRGTKLKHRFRVSIDGVPEGQAESIMTEAVTSAMEKVPDLTVASYQAVLSDARTKQVHADLLAIAVADARAFAETAATAADLSLESVRALRIGGLGSSSRPYEMTEEVLVMSHGAADAYRGFSAYGQLASEIRVSVRVVVEYDCATK